MKRPTVAVIGDRFMRPKRAAAMVAEELRCYAAGEPPLNPF